MLVGVGLVELKSISKQFSGLAEFVGKGLGSGPTAEIFAFFGLLWFGGSGFVFGFIWARIYLRRWFSKADEDVVRSLDSKISRIEADAQALALVNQQLYRSAEDKPASVDEVRRKIEPLGAGRTGQSIPPRGRCGPPIVDSECGMRPWVEL